MLVKALQADYWKPIQSGTDYPTDADTIQQTIDASVSTIHPASYTLTQPLSPHHSAALDKVEIDMGKINIPNTNNQLIIEGAGGLLVPLNQHDLYIDWLVEQQLPIVLVTKNYLGSINHTLLSLKTIQHYKLQLVALVINGKPYAEGETIIEKEAQQMGADVLRMPWVD